ncbi:hypothetical protein [Kitasatospora sp. NPDC092286]|uniref:hypothetical protein n=1 Tax=Kitasatospora sp. NPDC092286 TaxID=3364087 RepID=UPI0038293F96
MEEVQRMNEFIKPGEVVTRQQVHAAFGGRLQGAISPTKDRRVIVFLPPRPLAAAPTGLASDGTLHFQGEGLEGDQQMTQGNKALLQHKEDGRSVHVFQAVGRVPGAKTLTFRYIGQFEVDDAQPYFHQDEEDRHGLARRVIIFRLRPLDGTVPFAEDLVPPPSGRTITITPRPRTVEVEAASPQRLYTSSVPSLRRDTATRGRALVGAFTSHLHDLGHTTGRMAVTLPDGSDRLLVDLFDRTTGTIYEVKTSASRASIRTAIGSLMDLRWRSGGSAGIGIILPSEPYDDILALCSSLDIEVVWPDSTGHFASSRGAWTPGPDLDFPDIEITLPDSPEGIPPRRETRALTPRPNTEPGTGAA